MDLKKAILDFLSVVHGSEPVTVWESLVEKEPELTKEQVLTALQRMYVNGVLARSFVREEFRVNGSQYCYWLPEYYRGNPE